MSDGSFFPDIRNSCSLKATPQDLSHKRGIFFLHCDQQVNNLAVNQKTVKSTFGHGGKCNLLHNIGIKGRNSFLCKRFLTVSTGSKYYQPCIFLTYLRLIRTVPVSLQLCGQHNRHCSGRVLQEWQHVHQNYGIILMG